MEYTLSTSSGVTKMLFSLSKSIARWRIAAANLLSMALSDRPLAFPMQREAE